MLSILARRGNDVLWYNTSDVNRINFLTSVLNEDVQFDTRTGRNTQKVTIRSNFFLDSLSSLVGILLRMQLKEVLFFRTFCIIIYKIIINGLLININYFSTLGTRNLFVILLSVHGLIMEHQTHNNCWHLYDE